MGLTEIILIEMVSIAGKVHITIQCKTLTILLCHEVLGFLLEKSKQYNTVFTCSKLYDY